MSSSAVMWPPLTAVNYPAMRYPDAPLQLRPEIGATQLQCRPESQPMRILPPQSTGNYSYSQLNPAAISIPREVISTTPGRLRGGGGERYDESSPVTFASTSLPLPCAYLRIPWPRGKHFARLLPARDSESHDVHASCLAFRQYIKRMIVEEICSSPPYYLMRYNHFSNLSQLKEHATLRQSRITPFFFCRRAFPAVQALSTQQSFLREPQDNFLSIKEFEHPQDDADILVIHAIVPGWEKLPINYRSLEAAWGRQVVPLVSTKLLAEIRRRPIHLVVAYDCAQDNLEWSHHNMRQVVHLVAQTVAVASSTMPLFLRPGVDSFSPEGVVSRKQQSFDSFQVVIYPPRRFNEGVAQLREQTTPQLNGPPPPETLYENGPMETAGERARRKAALKAMFENDRVQGRLVDSIEDNSTTFDDDDNLEAHPINNMRMVAPTAAAAPRYNRAPSRSVEDTGESPSSSSQQPGSGFCGVFAKSSPPPQSKPPRMPQQQQMKPRAVAARYDDREFSR